MKPNLKFHIAISCVYLWIGFVCGISFMEAWLKFQAPSVTVPIGLGIGRLVFSALNKVEWVFAVSITINLLLSDRPFLNRSNFAFFISLIILVVQTFNLLPALDQRAELHIQQKEIASSNLHFYYVATEIIKVSSLFIFSIKLFK